MKIRVLGRSFMAFVLMPQLPLDEWLAELDAQIARSPGFFDARPVIVDLGALTGSEPGTDTLLADLERRGISMIDVENAGAVPGADVWRRPLIGGRSAGEIDMGSAKLAPMAPEETSLIVSETVRSGQSVMFTRGDITVVGSVSSGAEVLAGGSIHVYGKLCGRAIAGALGRPEARIFCRRFEAELVSIDGYYTTADDMDPASRGRAVGIRLDGESIVIEPLK